MNLDDYKIVLDRQEDASWVAEVPAISGCYALMPSREEALAEFGEVFRMIAQEYATAHRPLPMDATQVVNAWPNRARPSTHRLEAHQPGLTSDECQKLR